MSARFWLIGMTAAGMSLISGLSLGLYATTAPKSAIDREIASTDPAEAYYVDHPAQHEDGPAVVNCRGCGPTLAERRFASDMAGWDGYQDSLVQEYMSEKPGEDPPPSIPTAQSLTPADGPDIGDLHAAASSAQLAQGGASIRAVAEPTGSY